MPLLRSEKARLELSSGQRALNLRERGALFLADGLKVQAQLQQLLQDDGSILQKLMSEGYLVRIEQDDAGAASLKAAMAAQAAQPFSVAVQPPESSADTFQGKRSLATTRMFLFDMCERLFSRQAPELARHYRDHLREARDRESMLLIASDILQDVGEMAGPERAQGLRERISLLLPD